MWVFFLILALVVGLAIYDVLQRRHAILRNFPVLGHFRYWLEAVGPELRQYIVTGNDEERPFSRDQRRWVYASSKLENNYFGFGTDNDLERSSNHLVLRQSAFPLVGPHPGEVSVGREAMMAIGCIQAQRCHTGHCPTGVATQNRWLMRGLDPRHKAARLANYVTTLRKELLQLSRDAGADHPAALTLDSFEILDDRFGSRPAGQVFVATAPSSLL